MTGERTVVHRHLPDACLVEVDDAGVIADIDTPEGKAASEGTTYLVSRRRNEDDRYEHPLRSYLVSVRSTDGGRHRVGGAHARYLGGKPKRFQSSDGA